MRPKLNITITKAKLQPATVVGVAEHGNSAILVTVARGGELLDRSSDRPGALSSPEDNPLEHSPGAKRRANLPHRL
jgi:hypothetical protein